MAVVQLDRRAELLGTASPLYNREQYAHKITAVTRSSLLRRRLRDPRLRLT